MTRNLSRGTLALLWLLAGCGGKSVVDGTSGGGGEGGTTATSTTTQTTWTNTTWTSTTWTVTTATTTWTTTTTVTDVCTSLEEVLAVRLAAALECNPMLSVEQCTGTVVVYDQCGCMLAANAFHSDLASDALAAYDNWTSAGCGPYLCEWCPPAPPSPWFCMPGPSDGTGQCQPAYEG